MDIFTVSLVKLLEYDIPTPYRIYMVRHKTLGIKRAIYTSGKDKQDVYAKLSRQYPNLVLMAWKITEVTEMLDNDDRVVGGLNRRPRHLSNDSAKNGVWVNDSDD